MEAMDFMPPKPRHDDDNNNNGGPKPLPEEPTIQIWNMELLRIDSGSPEVERFAKAAKAFGHTSRDLKEMREDPNQSELEALLKVYLICAGLKLNNTTRSVVNNERRRF
jgi:hypothetical protein